MAISVVLVDVASRSDSVLVHFVVGVRCVDRRVGLLVDCIRHAMGVAVHVLRFHLSGVR